MAMIKSQEVFPFAMHIGNQRELIEAFGVADGMQELGDDLVKRHQAQLTTATTA